MKGNNQTTWEQQSQEQQRNQSLPVANASHVTLNQGGYQQQQQQHPVAVVDGVPNAIHVDAHVVGDEPVVYANVVHATPIPDGDGRERGGGGGGGDEEDMSRKHVEFGVRAAIPLCVMSSALFVLGCATMNYMGFGAGAWYAGLFVFLSAILFLMGGKIRTCNTRNMVISSLVVSILAIILSFFGMIADFVWMGFAKHVTACDETGVIVANYGDQLVAHGLFEDAQKCDRDCFTFHPAGDDRDATSLCYNNNWGTCNDFCEGAFQHLAATCGTLGLFSFMGMILLSISACCGLCVARRR